MAPRPDVRIEVRSTQGQRRTEMQDAWSIATPRNARGATVAAGVFDGVGGRPKGRAASAGAARAMGRSVGRHGDPADALDALDPVVGRSGGYSTGILLVAPPESSSWELAWRGDGGVWVKNPGARLRRLVGKQKSRPQPLRTYLGADTPTATCRVTVKPGGWVALATDGVPPAWLREAASKDAGAPAPSDDATLVVLHRVA